MIKLTAFVCAVAAVLGCGLSVCLGFNAMQVIVVAVLAAVIAPAWNTCSRPEKYIGAGLLLSFGFFASFVWGEMLDQCYVVDAWEIWMCRLRFYVLELPAIAALAALVSSLGCHQPLDYRRQVSRRRAQFGDAAETLLSLNPPSVKARGLRNGRVPAA